jgi:hypothetical protein
MKSVYSTATAVLLALTASAFAKEGNGSLDLATLLQPLGADGVYTEAGYATWDGQPFKEDGRCLLINARWKAEDGDWMKTSGICVALADSPAGSLIEKWDTWHLARWSR